MSEKTLLRRQQEREALLRCDEGAMEREEKKRKRRRVNKRLRAKAAIAAFEPAVDAITALTQELLQCDEKLSSCSFEETLVPAPCPEGAGFVVGSAASSSSAPASGSIAPQPQRAAPEVHQEFEQTFDPPPSADVIQAAERLGGARALAG